MMPLLETKPTEKEIKDTRDKASGFLEHSTKWPGMSYEEGVYNTLMWLLGDYEENPMQDE